MPLSLGFGLGTTHGRSGGGGAAVDQSGAVFDGTSSYLTATDNFIMQSPLGTPTGHAMAFVSFVMPASGTTRGLIGTQNRFKVTILSDNTIRFQASNDFAQVYNHTTAAFSEGDRVNFLFITGTDATNNASVIYQVNDSAPVLSYSRNFGSGDTLRDNEGTLYIGRDGAAGGFFVGTMYRAELFLGGTYDQAATNDAEAEAIIRRFCNADGSLVSTDVPDTEFHTPQYRSIGEAANWTAGTNFGTRDDFNSFGTFTDAPPPVFLELASRSYAADLAAGETVGTFEQNPEAPTVYTITDDPLGLYEIDGKNLVRSSTAATYTGSTHSVTIAQVSSAGTTERTFDDMFVGQTGEDTLLGRASISLSRSAVYTGEHIDVVVEGLTEREKALLSVTIDSGDTGKTFSNRSTAFNNLYSAQVHNNYHTSFVYDDAGSYTITVNIYRAGSTTAVWTDTASVTVNDTSTIPSADTVTVAASGADYTSVGAALDAVWSNSTLRPQLILVERGETFTNENLNQGNTGGVARHVLIRATGTGANPVIEFTDDGGFGLTVGSGHSLSISGIDGQGVFDGVNIVDGRGVGTQKRAGAFIGGVVAGHFTISNCQVLGMACLSFDRGDIVGTLSACAWNTDIDEYEPYAAYLAGVNGGGLLGCSSGRVSGNQPNIAKDAWAFYRPTEPASSRNAAWRSPDADSYVVYGNEMSMLWGWSRANVGSTLAADFPSVGGDPSYSTKQPIRSWSSPEVINAGANISIVGNHFEGSINFVSDGPEDVDSPTSRNWANFGFKRNRIIGGTFTGTILNIEHTGGTFARNVVSFGTGTPETSDVKRFLFIPPNTRAVAFADVRNRRTLIVGNIFGDLRSATDLHSGDDGNLSDMFLGIDDPTVLCEGNIVYVPNRTVSDPGIPGITLVTDSAEFDTSTLVAGVAYAGMNALPPANMDPYVAPSYDTAYATDADAGAAFQPTASATFLTDWTVDETKTPAYTIDANSFTGGTIPAGAYVSTA